MISEVYDIECLSNLFTYTGYCRADKKVYQFVIHQSRNDYLELIKHLRNDSLIMIGYNNLNYDYPILHHLLNHVDEYLYLDGYDLSQKIYTKSQEVIEQEFSAIAEWNTKIPQIDLFKIWHFDNVAKATSLKSLEFAMNLENIEDMPYPHNYWITKSSEIDEVLRYNAWDVFATNKFLDITLGKTDFPLYKGKNKIELRHSIAKKLGISVMNFNDIKIGIELILHLYCKKFGFDKKDIKKLRTYRQSINLNDCIPSWCNFKSKEFKSLERHFRNNIITGTKGDFKKSIIYHGTKIDYGIGGAHSSIKPGVYKSNSEWMIYDLDADGLYPNLAINQGLYPEHLGKEFLSIYYGEIVAPRMVEKKKPKKERDFVIVEGFKLAANGFYGKTNSEDSYAYDPLYTMKTTISGQIMISMWLEKLCIAIPELTIIQINTDGITLLLPKEKKELCLSVTDEMTKITGLTFEANEYESMIIRDVNNYAAKYISGDFKYKGAFEIDKELHKDSSMRIVPIAISNYFFKGISVSETIKNHTNIYDFCIRLKTDKSCNAEYHYLEEKQGYSEKKIKKLGKTTRYYISNHGGALYKNFGDGRLPGVNVGFIATLFNKYEQKDIKEYDINYKFYIAECNKIINQIEDKQLSLF